jgi:hypothetical protein
MSTGGDAGTMLAADAVKAAPHLAFAELVGEPGEVGHVEDGVQEDALT